MKRLIIHVGAPKTGSTSLQEFLSQRRCELWKHGCAYHQLPGSASTCHWWFAAGFFDRIETFAPAINEVRRGGSAQKIRGRSARSRVQLKEELSTCPTVILSAEQFFFMPLQVVERMRAFADEIETKVTIAVYVRDPVSAAKSEINQKVKMGFGSLESYLANPPVYPLKEAIARFVSVFGKEGVRVRPYGKDLLTGGNVCEDFVAHFLGDLDLSCGKTIEIYKNPSLSAEALFMVDEFNRSNKDVFAHSPRRDELLARLERIEGAEFEFSPETIVRLMKVCQSDLDYLTAEWGLDFSTSVKEKNVAGSVNVNEDTCRSMMRAFLDLV